MMIEETSQFECVCLGFASTTPPQGNQKPFEHEAGLEVEEEEMGEKKTARDLLG